MEGSRVAVRAEGGKRRGRAKLWQKARTSKALYGKQGGGSENFPAAACATPESADFNVRLNSCPYKYK